MADRTGDRMSAEQIRAEAVSALNGHQPFEDIYMYCTCGVRVGDDGGYAQHVVDVLAAAGLLPTGAEYKPDPTEWPRREYRVMRRYVGEWKYDPDADWSEVDR